MDGKKERIEQEILEKIKSFNVSEEEDKDLSTVDVLKIKRRMLTNKLVSSSVYDSNNEDDPVNISEIVKAVAEITKAIALIEKEEQKSSSQKQSKTNEKIDAAERKRIKETAQRLLS